MLRPGGRLGLLGVSTPPNPLQRVGHQLWFRRAVTSIGGALSGRAAYRYFPDSVAYLPDEHGMREILRQASFSGIGMDLLYVGLGYILTATRASAP